jgi:hypothetical protein
MRHHLKKDGILSSHSREYLKSYGEQRSLYNLYIPDEYLEPPPRTERDAVKMTSGQEQYLGRVEQADCGLAVFALMVPSGQSSWLQTQRSLVRFPALPDFLCSSGCGTGSTQPRKHK